MGKVFTPTEISEGLIPGEGDHLEAALYVVDQLFDGNGFKPFIDQLEETGIHSGMVHGSITHGTHNVRSDLDVVMLYDPALGEPIDVSREVFTEVKDRYHVPIEVNSITVADALRGNHRLDPFFVKYLLEAERNDTFCRGEPASIIAEGMEGISDDAPMMGFIRAYIASKTTKFAEALQLDEKFDEHTLQRALELPKNLGRKVLSMYIPDFSAWQKSTSEILDDLFGFVATVPSDAAMSSYKKLSILSQEEKEYDSLLSLTLEEEVPLATYERWIRERKRNIVRTAMEACVDIQEALAITDDASLHG